ncbi:MAG TPA: MFS transporter [Longimicrobiaceae bacterium]|nr:MFS transporter [Longimicrobiaceae bacterium]
MPSMGKAGDLFGRKRVYLLGWALSIAFSGLAALSWSAGALITFRLLSACAGAATGPASMALILSAFPPEERVKAMGWWSFAGAGPVDEPVELERWADFHPLFGAAPAGGYLAAAVSAFFRNGGERCRVVRLDPAEERGAVETLRRALHAIRPLETVDLVCAPDLMRRVVALPEEARARAVGADERDSVLCEAVEMQRALLEHCDRAGDRMALLDALPGASPTQVRAQRCKLAGNNGALYYPWLLAEGTDGAGEALVPPCGHVAGVYARVDALVGVHRAPANERLEGVLDVETLLDDATQAGLNAAGINCIRAFPGRGVRVWGARTLSTEPAWEHVNVRRVFLTLGRWVSANLAAASFEPSSPLLWARIGRELSAYLTGLFQRGALRGGSPDEAFYVRCDASTNPPEAREAGVVVTEIGLAPVVPNEFIVVRITHGPSGLDLAAPSPAA